MVAIYIHPHGLGDRKKKEAGYCCWTGTDPQEARATMGLNFPCCLRRTSFFCLMASPGIWCAPIGRVDKTGNARSDGKTASAVTGRLVCNSASRPNMLEDSKLVI